jgi:4-hydroxy-3-methylbut-2-enyl diphosphate reductase IspH
MPINRYINVEMGSAEIDRLNVAYAKALRILYLVDRHDPVAEIVARKVIDVSLSSGVTDPQAVADTVVRHFRNLGGAERADMADTSFQSPTRNQL